MGSRGREGDSEDRPRITADDLETLRLAASMGYYESPRRCRMEDIAEELGISKSAVYHRMNKVEREAVSWFLETLGVEEPLGEDAEQAREMLEGFDQWLDLIDDEELPFEVEGKTRAD